MNTTVSTPPPPLHADDIPRYIRFNPRSKLVAEAQTRNGALSVDDVLLHMLRDSVRNCNLVVGQGHGGEDMASSGQKSRDQLAEECCRVPWLPWAFSMPRAVQMAQLSLFKAGDIYSMDAASMLSVVALGPKSGENVWDTCCAPAMKLALIADMISMDQHNGPPRAVGCAVGMDVSPDRMYVARKALQKYDVPATRLYLGDSRRMVLPLPVAHDDDVANKREQHLRKVVKRVKRGGKEVNGSTIPCGADGSSCLDDLYATDVALHTPTLAWKSDTAPSAEMCNLFFEENQGSNAGFDRVLVDTECTHDGSLIHVSGKNKKAEHKMNTGHAASAGASATTADDELPEKRKKLSATEERASASTTAIQQEVGEDTHATILPKSTGAPLLKLQADLLQRGFDVTKVGGSVVYSTCSFTREQNEGIVEAFLVANHGKVQLVHPFEELLEAAAAREDERGSEEVAFMSSLPGDSRQVVVDALLGVVEIIELPTVDGERVGGPVVRVDTVKARTSFQFIAKFKKIR